MRGGLFGVSKSKRGFSAVGGAALMVTMTVGMSASLYFMIGGILPPTGGEPTFVSLSSRGYSQAPVPGYCCLNDSILEVDFLRGERQPLGDGVLRYVVVSGDGSQVLVQGDITPSPDSSDRYLGVYHGSPDEPSVINVAYLDGDANGFLSATDYVEVRGMSKEYHNAKLLVESNAGQIGSIVLL